MHEASAHGAFTGDLYVRANEVRSVLCLPILKQARMLGILYLENRLTSHAFTPARMAVFKLLASEAAISMENARLYLELAEREARIRRLVDANIIGIVIWDFEGRILEANDAYLQMVGYEREDLLSGRMRWKDLTPPEWLEREERHLLPILSGQGAWRRSRRSTSVRTAAAYPCCSASLRLGTAATGGRIYTRPN